MEHEHSGGWADVRRDAAPIAFVALAWLVQSWLLASMVLERTVDIPFMDEWEMVPILTGHQPVTLSWLWSQHNEHRIFVPRLVYLAMTSLSGYDFRAGAFLNVFLLCLCALTLCFSVRKLRGSTRYSDAFFPLVVLHWGQAENLTWSFQLAFVLGAVPVLLVLGTVFSRGALSLRQTLAVGAVAAALPFIGAVGLPLTPALSACTLLSAYQLWRARPEQPRQWLSALGLGLLGFATTALYFVGYHSHKGHESSHDLGATLIGAGQLLSLSFGTGSQVLWPATGYLMVLLLLATGIALSARVLRAHDEWPRVVRIALTLGGVLALAGGVAHARVAMFNALFISRYCTLMMPLACGLYLAWEALQNKPAKRFMQALLFTISAVFVLSNRSHGFAEAEGMWMRKELVVLDIRKGVPLPVVAQQQCGAVYLCNADLAARMEMLREKGIGEFAGAHP